MSKSKVGACGPAIKAIHIEDAHYHGVVICNQCSEPECKEVCPTGAITKSVETGVVRIQESRCIGCGLCTLACPYGGIYYDSKTRKAFKCDYCDGKPACVEACPKNVLTFIKSRPVLDYLKEDLAPKGVALCQGCGTEIAARFTMRVLGQDIVLVYTAGCAGLAFSGNAGLGGSRVANVGTLFWNAAPMAAGIYRYYHKLGKEIVPVVFVGDGATADIGFGVVSAAAERGERILYICYDNEAYMNTGIQQSGTTPFRAWSTTTPVGKGEKGKKRLPKDVPLLMAMHGIPYVATVTIAYLEDFAQKLVKAKQALKNGMAYIHLLAPCPTGWRAPTDSLIELSRMAVETNYFPLWEAANGEFRLTHEVKAPRPIADFTNMMGRFSHLGKNELGQLQKIVDSKFYFLKALTDLSKPVLCQGSY